MSVAWARMRRIITTAAIAAGFCPLSLFATPAAEAEPTRAEENSRATADYVMVDEELVEERPFWRDPDQWSFQVGVAFITDSTINSISQGEVGLASGDAGGQLYLLQASLKLGSFEPSLFGWRVDLDLELPAVLGLVDERGSDLFLQYNAGVTLRWKTFPWNRWLYTNLETGVGLTYSGQVLEIERERYPDRERSHLEFYWPIQLTLAHPRHPRHQLSLLIHHHSGGHIFHKGGANSVGFGYRLLLGK
jgi:hypothetical protein